MFIFWQKEKDNKLTPKTEESDTNGASAAATAGCAAMPSPAYSNQPVNSPAYSNPNINSPAYNGNTMNSPAYTNQPVNSPAYSQTPSTPQATYPSIASPTTPYQYGTPHNTGYAAAPSPALPNHSSFAGQNVPSPAAAAQAHYNTPMPSPAPSATPYTPASPAYPQTQSVPQTQNFVPPHPIQHSQQNFSSFNHQQAIVHQQMFNQMISHQQQMIHHHQQRYSNASYTMGSNGYPQHICGHFASMHSPPAALQLPCPSCQGRSMNDMSYSQNHGANWQANAMGMNPHYQHSYNHHHMAGVHNQNFNYMNSAYNASGSMGSGMMNFGQPPRDIQCGDVSQSSQSKSKSKAANAPAVAAAHIPPNPANAPSVGGKPKSQKEQSNELLSSCSNNPVKNLPPDDTKPERCPVDQNNKAPDATAPNGNDDSDSKNNYMKQDTYQRTLEYVQQCQNWNTTAIKEEVSSTTDQKPNLGSNGMVSGYVPPSPAVPDVVPPSSNSLLPIPSDTNNFLTPLSVSMAETPNMVLNNLTSSLNSLQQENKYLQMLQ